MLHGCYLIVNVVEEGLLRRQRPSDANSGEINVINVVIAPLGGQGSHVDQKLATVEEAE